jgi:hypothetical protein
VSRTLIGGPGLDVPAYMRNRTARPRTFLKERDEELRTIAWAPPT